MGFCLFNNVAVAAGHALDAGGLTRILVVDPDVHHGNGTEHAFSGAAEVLYASSHRYPFYPGTGAVDDAGVGPGRGYTVNLPLPAFQTRRRLPPRARGGPRADRGPLPAGADPRVGGLRHLAERPARRDAHERARLRRPLRASTGAGPTATARVGIVCTLEGGYDPTGLTLGVRAAIRALAAPRAPEAGIEGRPSAAAIQTARAARRALSGRWSFPPERR